ncbi:MAG: M28 family peptidase [Dehalococcoidia bacterium]
MPHDDLIPAEATIYGWIEQVFAQGLRRPGYPADRWAEQHCLERFRDFGLENVRHEPVELPYWEPRRWSLTVTGSSETLEIACFPLPHAAPTPGLEAELVAYDREAPARVQGKFSLYDVTLNRPPHAAIGSLATWTFDPDRTFANSNHILPFGAEIQGVMEPSMAAGAVGFVGVLKGYPGDSHDYYVPYDGVERPIPGLWVSGSDGVRLHELLAAGPTRARLEVDSVRETITSYNVVGELRGADDEIVVIGSHHDGPWASAVEDGSGIALVFAQAEYWARVSQEERPHRLVFLLNAGHMVGGAGMRGFIEAHRPQLERIVLGVHLEHAANECEEDERGELRPTGLPEARWWFTTRSPQLEATVRSAIEAEDLRRSHIVPPTIFGPHPTTDGGFFHSEGVPLVNYLTAPFYLFDSQDTLDKIHKPSLVPVTRAALRIIEATAGVSAREMRAGVVTGT